MEIGQLYQYILLLVLIGLISGVGIVCLATFGNTSVVLGSTTASAAINASIAAISSIPTTWLGLITVIVVMSIIIVLVIRSFGSMGGR